MKWHLHVTVKPHWSWTLSDVASALARDMERHGVRPVVLTNHFETAPLRSYKEIIATKHLDAPHESDASREIFRMGVLLNNAGWRVKRLKIEGDVQHAKVCERALYFETHLKNLSLPLGVAPRSTSAAGTTFHTVRRDTVYEIHDAITEITSIQNIRNVLVIPKYHIEAAVLDTNPAMDHDWINQ